MPGMACPRCSCPQPRIYSDLSSHKLPHSPLPVAPRDYNDYVLRNLSRGYSRQDLGLSLFKEKRIKATAQMKQFSEKINDRRLQARGGGRRRSKGWGECKPGHKPCLWWWD